MRTLLTTITALTLFVACGDKEEDTASTAVEDETLVEEEDSGETEEETSEETEEEGEDSGETEEENEEGED